MLCGDVLSSAPALSLLLSGELCPLRSGQSQIQIPKQGDARGAQKAAPARDFKWKFIIMDRQQTAELEKGSLWEGASLVAGTAIGGGMLAIPLFTFEGGIGSAALASLGAWACLTTTGLAFCRVLAASPGCVCWLSLVRHWLGSRVAGAITLFLLGFLWLLLTAYSAGGASLLGSGHISTELASLLFLGPLVVVLAAGRRRTARLNSHLFSLLLLAAVGMALLAGPVWQSEAFMQTAVQKPIGWWAALPVLFAAFGFHAVLPTLGKQVRSDVRRLSQCVVLGTTVALVLILSWQVLVFGCLRPEELQQLALQGRPVTCALGDRTSWAALFGVGSMLFAYLALATSFLGVAQAGLDLLHADRGLRKRLVTLMALIGSAWSAAMLHPSLFGKALSLAGGLGVSLLNGVLPITLLFAAHRGGKISCSQREKRAWFVVALVSLIPVVVEIMSRLK
jgi:tyrosine-specific transport protein